MIQIADRVVERMELSREARFAAALKGLVEVHGRISAPFSLLVAFGGRVREHDADFTRYRDFLALHVDQDKVSQYLILTNNKTTYRWVQAWFSLQQGGRADSLVDMTDVVVTGSAHIGLDPDTITTYWLSYDRDNMVIKYGKEAVS